MCKAKNGVEISAFTQTRPVSSSLASATEDGHTPGPRGNQTCPPYETDYNPQDWAISLTELLRVIQFYNSGGYNYCPASGSEDEFCAGLT